jgi:cytochrome b
MMLDKILVWDIPVRVFHWLLVLSFAGAFITGDSERYRDLHVMFGYTLLGLIGFRLLWGVIGSSYARFRSFLFGPRQVLSYLRSLLSSTPAHYVGHNPAGSWAIYALLALGLVSTGSGYVIYAEFGGERLEELFEELHEISANAMLAVVIVHILGVLLSSVLHHENLVGAMLSGYKYAPATASQGSIRHAHWLIGGLLLAAVIAYWGGWI